MEFWVDEGCSSGEKEITMGNGDIDKIYDTGNEFYQGRSIGVVTGVDQSGNSSDSNSEVSATESVATTTTNKTNLSMYGENENSYEKINMPFIDFLGVGAS